MTHCEWHYGMNQLVLILDTFPQHLSSCTGVYNFVRVAEMLCVTSRCDVRIKRGTGAVNNNCTLQLVNGVSGEGPRSGRYGRTAALRLIVQPYDEDDDDDYYFLSFSW
jgi:hypothetical protein